MRLTGFLIIFLPISSSITCGLTISNKIIYGIVIQKYNKYEKHFEKDQQAIEFFYKLYRKSSQKNVIYISEYESLWKIFTRSVDETKNKSFFYKHEQKTKNNFFLIIN